MLYTPSGEGIDIYLAKQNFLLLRHFSRMLPGRFGERVEELQPPWVPPSSGEVAEAGHEPRVSTLPAGSANLLLEPQLDRRAD